MVVKNITNPFKAEFSQNRQKGKNITKPTEPELFSHFCKLQNETYLETQNYKTTRFYKEKILKTIFPKRLRSVFADSEANHPLTVEKSGHSPLYS